MRTQVPHKKLFSKTRNLFIFVSLVLGSLRPLWGSVHTQTTPKDSLSPETQIELQIAQIDRNLVTLSDSTLVGEVRLFRNLAATAQKNGDFELATFYTHSALDILFPKTPADESPKSDEAVPLVLPQQRSFQNEWSVSSGMDISRQDFEIVYSGQDSNLMDATNNPFLGVGLDGFGKLGGKTEVDWNGSARLSRDYTLADFHASAQLSLPHDQTGSVWTDLEGMAYRRDFTMKYAQALGGVQWEGGWHDKINAFAEAEIARRSYDHPSQNFPDYFRSRFWGYVKLFPPFFRWIRLSAQFENRTHKRYSELDYSQKQIAFRSFAAFHGTQLTLQIDRRALNYTNNQLDTLFFFSSYRDWQSTFLVKQKIAGPFALKLDGYFVLRKYLQKSSFLVNYDYFNLIPAISWSFSSNLTLNLGTLLIHKKYAKSKSLPAYWAVKDYSVHGIQFGFDFLNFQSLMLSGQISYELRRHKGGGKEKTTEGFNLYTNQNETTAMLFASWQFLRSYELNVILHKDTAIDQELKHNDSRVSIFTVELQKKF